IVVQRELARMSLAAASSSELDSVTNDFLYAGIDTCAADGLCATACPVGINTGEFIKHLRNESIKDEKPALWIANHFALVEKTIGTSVMLGHIAEKIVGTNGVKSMIQTAEKISHTTLPKWNHSIPSSTKNLRALRGLGGATQYGYFPSCISRQLGVPSVKSQASGSSNLTPDTSHRALSEALLTIAQRAGIRLHIPNSVTGHCCGMPFASKGYNQASQIALRKTLQQMWDWSEHGQIRIVIDTTSCTHTLRTCSDDLSAEDKEL